MGVRVREIDSGSGVYYIFINFKKRRRAQRVGTKAQADYVAQKIRKEIGSGNFKFEDEEVKEDTITLQQYFTGIDSKNIAAGLSESTVDGYEADFRLHVGPALGNLPLNKIDRKTVKNFVAQLVSKGLKKPSIRKIVAELCAMLNRAVEDEFIIRNPAARLSKYYKHATVRDEPISPLSREEVPVFLNAVKEHNPYYFPVFATFLHSGLRPGELAALRWSCIDWENRWIEVRSSINRRGNVGKTKTGKIRKVDMSDFLIETLRQWQKDQQEKFADQLPEWFFLNKQTTTRLDLKNLYHRPFQQSLEKAKLKPRGLHALRHTFATLLIMSGESLAYVRDQLGHSNIALTVDTYTHWIPGSNRQAVNKLPALTPIGSNVREFRKAQ
jgi:integrase